MPHVLIFCPSLGARLSAVLFFIACAVVVFMCVQGIRVAEGMSLMVLTVATFFPVLMFVTAALRMTSILSRRLVLTASQLDHRQVFKNYSVPLHQIRRIETQRGPRDRIVTLRVLWPGVTFYVDERAIVDFTGFLEALIQRAPRAEVEEVSAFTPSGG